MRALLLAALSLLLLTVGCGSPASPPTGAVIVGLTSELRAGVDIDRLHVTLRANGEVLDDRVLLASGGQLRFPSEFAFEDLEGGTPIEIALEAFIPGQTEAPLVVRAARTEVLSGLKLLLRVRLDTACVLRPDRSACPAEQTCIAGACSDPRVDPGSLEPYTPAWADGRPDACKPAGAGDPIVIVGQGQGDYLPLGDLEEAQVEAGPQGGHHIWVALRMKNLRQSSSLTSVQGAVPELGYEITPYTVIFTFDPDEGGFCTLAGLRFQLDEGMDIQALLGRVADIEVTVRDPEGATGVGKRRVTLSRTIL